MKKNMRTLLSLALTSTILCSAFSCVPSIETKALEAAEAESVLFHDTMELYQDGAFPALTEAPGTQEGTLSVQSLTVEQTIFNGLYNAEESIDIQSYQLTAAELKVIMQNVINTSPELFYLNSSYGYTPSFDGHILSVNPIYNVSGETLQQQKTFYENTMNGIVSQIEDSWSDLQKILFAHDYLAQNFEYDTTYQNHDAYTFFTTGTGVCQSYTLVFLGIMKKVGIEASVASSSSMNHIWNLVKLDGKWYHVDNTWDDPLKDKFGMARHNNLLLSDTAIQTARGSSQGHTGWNASYTCTDTTYDTCFWENSTTPFQYLDGNWYYAYYDTDSKNSVLATYDFQKKSSSKVLNFDKWYTGTGAYYTNCFSGLDVYNGKLYYNSGTGIYSYAPATKTLQTVLTPNKTGSVYGIRIDGQTLKYTISDSPNNTGTIYNYTLEAPLTPTTPPPSAKPTASASPVVSQSPAPVISETPTASASPVVSQSPAPVISETPGTSQTPVPSPEASQEPDKSPAPSAYDLGDVDKNGKIDLADAQMILKAALKIIQLDTDSTALADVDGSQNISLADAQLVLKYALKIISSFK